MTEDKSILIKTAYAYYQKGDWDRAIEEYHKLADLDPGDLNVLNILADIYAKKGDLQEALKQYDLVAQGHDQKNQVDKVLQVYKRMLKLVPNNPELMGAVKTLVTKYLDRATQLEDHDPPKAGEIYKSILKADPNRYDAAVRYAKLLMRTGEKYQAIENLMVLSDALDPATQTGRLAEVLQLVTEWDPLHIEAHERLAKLLVEAKQQNEAVTHYRALVEIFISKNDYLKAEECAHKAIDLGDTETHYHLGVIHFNQEHYAEARSAFTTFLSKHESHVGALKYLALSHLKLNQHPEAVETYLRIMRVYVNENLLEEAREVRHTILELDPENAEALRLPAENVPEGGAPASEPEMSPADAAAEQERLMTEADGYAGKGMYDQAVDLYLELLKRWPDHAEGRSQLQKVYVLMAKAVEPEQKGPSPEEIRNELERELREQMKTQMEAQERKLAEEQARLAQERQAAIDRLQEEQEKERVRLQQELEAKLQEESNRSKEAMEAKLQAEAVAKQAIADRLEAEAASKQEMEAKLQAEAVAKQAIAERLQAEAASKQEMEAKLQAEAASKQEMEAKLQAEAAAKQAVEARLQAEAAAKQAMEARLREEADRSRREEELRQQLQKELEDKQKALEAQREMLESEKNDAFNRMKADLEKAQQDLETRIRDQVERELQERTEKETRERLEHEAREREKKAEREAKVQELLRQEEEQRKRFEEEKQKQASAQATINREILDGLERIRREKEREKAAPSPRRPSAQSPVIGRVPPGGNPSLDLSIESEVDAELTRSRNAPAPASAGNEGENLEDPFVRQTLADIYAKQGLFVEAVKIYEKILNEEPDNEEVRNKLRNVLKMKGL